MRIALCAEADVPALMRFIHESWSRDHVLSRNEALLRWQYDPCLSGNGGGRAPSVLLAWQGDRIVGMLGLTYMRWLLGGKTYRGAWTSNWVVTPEARGLNVAIELLQAARELGAEVLGSMGANAVSTRIVRGLGFELIPEIPRWFAVVNPEATVALLAGGEGQGGGSGMLTFCEQHRAYPSRAGSSLDGYEAVPWSTDREGPWDVCWSRTIATAFTGVTRDSAYLQWRYVKHPTFQYRLTLAVEESAGTVGGLAVSRVEQVRERPEKVMRVGELLAGDSSAATCLLRSIVRDAHDAGVTFVDFYCSRIMPDLARAGFHQERPGVDPFVLPSRFQPLEKGGRQMNAIIRLPAAHRGRLDSLASRGELYLTRCDGDQDRPN